MEETQSNVGQYRIGVSFEQPSDEQQRRQRSAMTDWLLATFENQRREGEDAKRRSAD